MKYKTIFDVNNKTTSWSYYVPVVFFFIFSTVFIVLSCVKKNTDMSYIISSAILTLCFLIWSLISITQVIADFMYLIKPYREHRCEQIDGIISDLVLIEHTACAESFQVSGMKFIFPNSSTRIGYKTTVSEGGCINKNGQNVRIIYVYNEKLGNDNVILKLEIEDEDEKEET